MRHRSLRIPHRSGRQDELPPSAPRSPSAAVPSRGLQETKQSMWGWRGPAKSCLSPQHKLLPSPSLKMQLTGRHRAQGKNTGRVSGTYRGHPQNVTLVLIPAREVTLLRPEHPDQHNLQKTQGAVPRTGCWSTSQATEQQVGPPSQALVLQPLDLGAASPCLRMQLTQAVFTQGMYSCNYRHDVMITGNPCPVEMQAEKGMHTAIC